MGLQAAREAVDDTAGAAEYIVENNLRDFNTRRRAVRDADSSRWDPGRLVMLARESVILRMTSRWERSVE
ncbi:hypothetical protein LINPERHAP1_LOCUS16824 [Linum perenne]